MYMFPEFEIRVAKDYREVPSIIQGLLIKNLSIESKGSYQHGIICVYNKYSFLITLQIYRIMMGLEIYNKAIKEGQNISWLNSEKSWSAIGQENDSKKIEWVFQNAHFNIENCTKKLISMATDYIDNNGI